MGIVSSLLGNLGGGVLQTSAMKGMNSGSPEGYGQSGIVGTILKMYLGGAIGGAMGGSAGGGASGMTGAMNGISSVTSNLSSNMLSGADSVSSMMDIMNGKQGAIGDFAQNMLANKDNYQQQQSQPLQSMQQMLPQQSAESDLRNMWQNMQQPPPPQSGLMDQPGIPEYIRQMMGGNRYG